MKVMLKDSIKRLREKKDIGKDTCIKFLSIVYGLTEEEIQTFWENSKMESNFLRKEITLQDMKRDIEVKKEYLSEKEIQHDIQLLSVIFNRNIEKIT